MPRDGRPPKPTRLKVLEGNRAKVRESSLGENEPKPALGIPEPPNGMGPEALRMWTQLSTELDRLGLVSVIDGGLLAAACMSYEQAMKAYRSVQKHGRTLKRRNQSGDWIATLNPDFHAMTQGFAAYHRFCVEFGLTPASRSKLSVAAPAVDDLEEALCG